MAWKRWVGWLVAVLPGTGMREHRMTMVPGSKETKDSDSSHSVQSGVPNSLTKIMQMLKVYLHYCSSRKLHPAQEIPKLPS